MRLLPSPAQPHRPARASNNSGRHHEGLSRSPATATATAAGPGMGGPGWVGGKRREYVLVGWPSPSLVMSVPANPPRPTCDSSAAAIGRSGASLRPDLRMGLRSCGCTDMKGWVMKKGWGGAKPRPILFSPSVVAATGNCPGAEGGWVVRGLERQEPRRATWTYLRVPRTSYPPAANPTNPLLPQPPPRGAQPFASNPAGNCIVMQCRLPFCHINGRQGTCTISRPGNASASTSRAASSAGSP